MPEVWPDKRFKSRDASLLSAHSKIHIQQGVTLLVTVSNQGFLRLDLNERSVQEALCDSTVQVCLFRHCQTK